MTAFGIVIGGAVAIGNPLALVKAGLGASMAIMVSGFFGAYMAEKTERKLELQKLERMMLRKLDGTDIEAEAYRKIIKLAAIDGFSPFLGAIIPIIPFFGVIFEFISYTTAIYYSVGISLVLLVALGWYLGKLMGEHPIRNALTFAAGGVMIGIISVFLDKL